MKRVMVRYKVKPDRAGENEAFIRGVFDELLQNGPDGLCYASFKAFQAEIKDRCDELPVAVGLDTIGAYRMFSA